MTNNEQKEKFLKEFKDSRGNITTACAAAEITRDIYRQWLNTDVNFKTAVEDIKEEALDFVEGKLLEKINGVEGIKNGVKGDKAYTAPPDTSAIIFYLKARGRRRGYGSKDEEEATRYSERVTGLLLPDEIEDGQNTGS